MLLLLRSLLPDSPLAVMPRLDGPIAALMAVCAAVLWGAWRRRGGDAGAGDFTTFAAPAAQPRAVPAAVDALKCLPDGIACFNSDDVLVFANPACARLCPALEDLFRAGTGYAELTAAAERRGVYVRRGPAEEGGSPRAEKDEPAVLRQLADGRWLRISERRTGHGGRLLMYSDVSMDRERDDQLRRHSRIVENVSEAALVVDADGRLADVNPAAETLLGYSREAIQGRPVAMLYPGPQAAGLGTQIERILALRGRWQGRLTIVRRDGEQRACDAVAVALDPEADGAGAHVIVSRDVSERRAAEARVEYLAHYDPLTALPNRVLFRDRLEQAIRRSEWRREGLAVIFIDLDNFKLINKGLGHERGDAVLRAAAGRLAGIVHPGDTLARLGDDKFALVQTEMHRVEQAAFRARHALDLLEPPVHVGGRDLRISASAGIAVYPADGTGAEMLVQAADVALSRAKAEGRNRCHFHVEGMTEATRLRCELEHDISPALQQEEFLLHYQPQVDLRTGRLVGCEALLRWEHPDLGLLLPDQFIPIAEETGAIVPIGEWCLDAVCAQVARWRQRGHDVPRVAINLSPVQFSSPHLLEKVARALQRADIPPECLEIEITEGAAMRDPDHAVDVLRHLNGLGVHSAIDDFGTGYSSLSHLKRFPVHSLKVDQSFVTGLAESGSDGAIVSAVIDLGHSLNMRVTAEGIENEAQVRFLRQHRCDYGQGYSFARALPASELPRFLALGPVSA